MSFPFPRPFPGPSMVSFSVLSLFAAGEVGVWYDPSDFSTMFQDSAGTTPVTAVEQPVGLLLDKSKSAIGTNGAKRINLLTYTEQFDNAAWSKAGSTVPVVTANQAVAPDGTNTADQVAFGSTSANPNYSCVTQSATTVAQSYTATVWMRTVSGTATVYLGAFTSAYVTPTACNLTTTWQQFSLSFTGIAGTSYLNIGPDARTGSLQPSTQAAATIYIWGADLRLSSETATSPTYQRITSDWPSTFAGNHASQSTAASRPVLSARVNLLTYTEQFDNAAWTKNATATVTANQTTAPDGTNTADLLVCASGDWIRQARTIPATAVRYSYSFYAKAASSTSCTVTEAGATASSATYVLSGAGTANVTFNGGGSPAATIALVGNGWYLCTFSYTSNGVQTTLYLNTEVTNGYIWGADLRPTNAGVNLPAYQRVVSGIPTTTNPAVTGTADYDTVGYPTYLRFDGVDDSLATGTITPGVDKAQVFAGVRKLSDAGYGMIAELSASSGANAGSLYLDGPEGAASNFAFYSRGSVAPASPATATGFAAPVTTVLVGLGDIGGDSIIIRANGSQAGSSAVDQGTGNYLAYPLYIGRRNGASFSFNGQLYSMILRFSSANLDATTISKTETWVNSMTKAY